MITAMWGIMLELAPWLLLGTAIAGALHVALPPGFVHRQLGGRWGIVKAVALGVPLPLCSCGVIPAGLGLRRDGASPGATVGFLISTPQTGVDSALVSASFLGWPFAVFKLLAAAVTGLVGGVITDRVSSPQQAAAGEDALPTSGVHRRDWRGVLDHAYEILRSIWRWLVFGIVASAAIETLLPEEFLGGFGQDRVVVPMLAALAVSLPLYVCATASVPIAAALVAGGFPGSAALVFLMAGPATNVATIGAIYRTLGRRPLVVYLTTIILGSMIAGWFFDSILSAETAVATHLHGDPSWWALSSSVVLLAVLAVCAIDDARRFFAARHVAASTENAIDVPVEGMTCNNCASRLEKALRGLDGVHGAIVILEPGRAIVQGSIAEKTVLEAIQNEGFRPAG